MPNKELLIPKYWPTWIGLGLLRLLGLLPLPVLAVLGYIVGILFFAVFIPRRKIALKNIRTCFPELSKFESLLLCLKNFAYMGQSLVTSGMTMWMSKKRLSRLITITGKQSFDNALADNRNIILLAPHFLALDIGGYSLSKDTKMISMYQHTKNKVMNETVITARSRFDGALIERKEPLRNLIRLIRKGYPFYYLPDQDAGRKGVFVPFFGQQASTFAMLGKFASMSKAVVIPCQTRIKPWGLGYEVTLGEPLDNFPLGDDEIDTASMNVVIEKMIEKMPEQYFWVHKRFKTQADGESKFYN